MSMAAKLSNLVDKTSGANLQVDGHVEVPTQGASRRVEGENPTVIESDQQRETEV